MKKKDYKNLKIKDFETKEKKDTDIAKEDKKIKTPPKRIPRNMDEFYGRYRHVI